MFAYLLTLTKSLRIVSVGILIIALIQTLALNLITHFSIQFKVIQHLSVGFFFWNSLYFVRLKFSNATLNLRKVKFGIRRNITIEIEGIHLRIQSNSTRKDNGAQKSIDEIILQLLMENSIFVCVKRFLPRKIEFRNVIIYFEDTEKTIQVETIILNTNLYYKGPNFAIKLLALETLDVSTKNSLHRLEYSLKFTITEKYENSKIRLSAKNCRAALKVGSLQLKLLREHGLFARKTSPQASTREILNDFAQIYRNVLLNLKVLDIKLESLHITLNNELHIFISTLIFSAKSILTSQHGMLELLGSDRKSPINNEIALAVNSVECHFNKKELLRVPVMNFTLNTDVLSYLFDSNCTELKVGCTITLVDPSIVFQLYQLPKLIAFFNSLFVSSQETTMGNFQKQAPPLTFFPHFIFKAIVSNFSCTLELSDLKHFVVRTSNVHAFIQNRMKRDYAIFTDRLKIEGLKRSMDHMDNFLKVDRFTFSYIKFDESAPLRLDDSPIVAFSKWEFFNKDIVNDTRTITSTLRELRVSLEYADALKDIGTLLQRWRVYNAESKCNDDHAGRTALQGSYNLKLRLKDASVSLLISGHLDTALDVVEVNGINLTSYTRGMSANLKEAYLHLDPLEKKFDIVSGSICRVMGHATKVGQLDRLATIANMALSICETKVTWTIPQLKMKFDVNVIWLFYYLRSIALTYIEGRSKGKESKRSNALLENLEVVAGSLVFDMELPHQTKLLLSFDGLDFTGKKSQLHIGKFDTFIRSVYAVEDLVFVPLLTIKNVLINVRSVFHDEKVPITVSSISLKTEYHLRFYKIVDNLITMVKAMKQIKLAYKDLSKFQRLEPSPEQPKKVPRINIKAQKLRINVEEDPFEQELGLIFKVGVLEQRERLEKLSLFEKHIDGRPPMTLNNLFAEAPASWKRDDNEIGSKRSKLYENFSTSWINRYRKAKLKFHGKPSSILERTKIGTDFYLVLDEVNSTVLKVKVNNLDMLVGPPSFPLENYTQFMFEYGKRIPADTLYTTLIPMGIDIKTDRWDFILRDYPLALLSFPDTHVTGDIVFAEKMPSGKSKRTVYVPFVPMATSKDYFNTNSIYGARITRTLNPVKTYMNLKCSIQSPSPTTITWGKSLQPGYQSVMLWFDYLTKPPLDPSEKLGFWDKFRLLIHGRLSFEWSEGSDVHLNIKGSHDPYMITDDGAGLSFCWSEGTKLAIHGSDDPTEFLKITSKSFLLAIRDFTDTQKFDKILMRLTGNVIWKLGLLFESGSLKSAGEEERSCYFVPHYKIELVNPKFIPKNTFHDSYKGFRSDFIHMSFGVFSDDKSSCSNRVHLAPHCMAHFLSWWSLFSTYTSGPIRQGPLFPDLVQNPKKFSRALFTVKYQLSLAPLTISHAYRHADSQLDLRGNNNIAFTGLKGNFGFLKIDLHQKRVKMIHTDDKLNISRTIWKFKMNAAEIDCVDADIRTIFTIFDQEAIEELLAKNLGIVNDSDCEHDVNSPSPARMDLAHDSNWYDFEDYTDLDQISLDSTTPLKFKAIPLLYSPRISYLRNLNDESLDVSYPFGDEEAHNCFLGHNHPERTQESLARKRAQEIEQQIRLISTSIESLNAITGGGKATSESNERLMKLDRQMHDFKHRLHIIHKVLEELEISKIPTINFTSDDVESAPSSLNMESGEHHLHLTNTSLVRTSTIESFRSMREVSSAFVKSSFNNRFIIHNILLKINKNTRDHLMSYALNMFNRKKTKFFRAYKAVALLDELLKSKFDKPGGLSESSTDFFTVEDLVSNSELMERFDDIIREVPGEDFEAFDNYQVKLVSPQIQITSETESEKAILVTARDIEISIIDINQVASSKGKSIPLDFNTLVETRYCTKLNEAHFFIFGKEEISRDNALGFCLNGYGMEDGSSYWPPWMPMEMCYNCEPLESFVFLKRNEMILTFTRPNSLFFNGKSHLPESNEARLRVGFPQVVLMSDSEQYSAIYAIVADLLSFASSFDKKVDKLSKVLLADEVKNNLDKLDASIVINLQNKIRELYRTRGYLKLHDPRNYLLAAQDIAVEIQVTIMELDLLMTAIKRNYDSMKTTSKKAVRQSKLNWQVGADELTWRLFDENKKPFIVFELGPSTFIRSQGSEGANSNKISISTLRCFNLQQNPVYSELLSPLKEDSKYDELKPLIEILWIMGVPVGGISDIEDLIVLLQPLKFKMDHKTSGRLLRYLFPGVPTTSVSTDEILKESDTSSVSVFSLQQLARRDTSMSRSPSEGSTSSGQHNEYEMHAVVNPRHSGFKNGFKPSNTVFKSADQDMNEMVERSSTFFNVRSVTIGKVTMSVSYKGSRSLITNVDNLTVKVPTIKYTNKLWSRNEFIATLKKDIVKVVLQHMGNIIGNKFIPHKKESKYDAFRQFAPFVRTDTFRSKVMPSINEESKTLSQVSKTVSQISNASSLSKLRGSNRPSIESDSPDTEDNDVKGFFPASS